MPPVIIDKVNPAELVSTRHQIAVSEMSSTVTKWERLLTQYRLGSARNLKRETDERGRIINADSGISRVSASTLRNAVETTAPLLMASFKRDGWFTVTPRPNSNTSFAAALNVEDMIQQQMEEAKMNAILRMAAKQTVKLGSAVLYVHWDRVDGTIYENMSADTGMDGMPTYVRRSRTGNVFSGPRIHLVPFRDFYPDPKGRNIDDCEYVIYESTISLAEIERRVTMGMYDGDAYRKLKKEFVDGGWGHDPRTYNDNRAIVPDRFRTDVRLIGYYEDKRYIYLAAPWEGTAEGVVLNPKRMDNPYDHQRKPCVQMRLNPDEDEFFPQGVIEVARDHQAIKSTMLNMMVDIGIKDIKPQRIISGNLEVDIKQLQKFVPDDVIQTQGMLGNDRPLRDDILELRSDPNGFMRMLPMILPYLDAEEDKITGVTSYLGGTAAVGSNKTARGVAQLTANAQGRTGASTETIAETMEEMLDMFLSMSHQFGAPSDDIYGSFRWHIFDDATADKAFRLQIMQSMLPLIHNLGGNTIEGVRRVLRDAGVPAIDSILPTDGSMEKRQEKQQVNNVMMQMLAAGQAGGAGVQ